MPASASRGTSWPLASHSLTTSVTRQAVWKITHLAASQVVVFDALALLVPVIGGDHIATKRGSVLKGIHLLRA